MSRTWITIGDIGPGVRRWQELLLEAGYQLPRWGADGHFGDETRQATIQAQVDLKAAGLYTGRVDCKVGDLTIEAMHERLGREPPKDKHKTVIDGVEVHDYRGHFPAPSNGRPQWGNRWPKLEGVVLHRTACRMGERPARYASMNAHIAVTLKGRIILVHPWNLHIWHGHRPSLWTIGIEFDGNPTGWSRTDEREEYFWRPGGGPDPITPEQVKAGLVLLEIKTGGAEQRLGPDSAFPNTGIHGARLGLETRANECRENPRREIRRGLMLGQRYPETVSFGREQQIAMATGSWSTEPQGLGLTTGGRIALHGS
jgi:hypothetical protein